MRMTEAALAARRANVIAITKRKREAQNCKRGHSEWGVYMSGPRKGKRFCRVCNRDSTYYAAQARKRRNFMRTHLTPRELQVLKEFAKCKTYKQIAETLGIHLHTVHSHQTWLFIKFGVKNRTSLVINAHREGIINLNVD